MKCEIKKESFCVCFVRNITTFSDLKKRVNIFLDKYHKFITQEDGKASNIVLIASQKDFNKFCILLDNKKFNKKCYYNYSFRGIPIFPISQMPQL